METDSIKDSVVFEGVSPHDVFEALMDSDTHAEFTGGAAEISRKEGGKFSVFDGYATGKNLKLVKDKSIVQSWRAEEPNWPEGFYSKVVFELEKTGDGKNAGTKLVFTQTNVPKAHVASIAKGWNDYYWTPMKKLFATRGKSGKK